jgi:hypothetical protein
MIGYYEVTLRYDGDCVDIYLMFGESIDNIKEQINKFFKDSLYEFEIISIRKSNIVGVI